jgi:phosphatidylglycerol:prolipoprotein diacylglycerol transferase
MMPFILQMGSFTVPAFFFMIMVGVLIATFFMTKIAEKKGLEVVVFLDLAIFGIIAGVLGSRIFHVLVEAPGYYWEDPIRVFYFWQGGFVSLGAFIGAIAATLTYLVIRKKPIIKYMDVVAFAVPIIIFFVRLGCFMNGCCYGKPTSFPIHLIFNNPASTAAHFYPDIPLHATQPYFMLNALIMWGLLWVVYFKGKMEGRLIAVFLMYEGVSRFFIEFLRGDEDRGLWFEKTLSSGQIVMALFFITGLVLFFVFRKRNKHV